MKKRHRWVQVRIHVYGCRDCGTVRENVEHARGQWSQRFYLPGGERVTALNVPPCEPGTFTASRLAKMASAIVCSV